MGSNRTAIVIPIYRETLQPDEEYAIRHVRRHLDAYDQILIVPHGLRVPPLARRFVRFADSYFTSTASYTKLLLSPGFYQAFAEYEFILIYQLDCLVFSDRLREWCRSGYDYVGAPLFKSNQSPAAGYSGTLNGGLSLRRVTAFLHVLSSRRYVDQPASFIADVFCRRVNDVRSTSASQKWVKRVRVAREVRQGVAAYAADYTLNEDHFWSDRAAYFDPGFRVAPPEVALDFAFEAAPQFCFKRNQRRLPFGCHAWAKYDRAFWEPYLLA